MSTPESITKEATKELNTLADKDVDSTDSDIRYMAYGARLRTALRAGQRYIAYTSDIGEAFRPVVPPAVVTAAYGISWLYLTGDVGYESYKAHRQGPTPLEAAHFSEPVRIGMVAAKRATFQSIASMALPAFTIHTAVKQAKKAFVNVSNPRVKTWGPTVTGLAIVPVLPYLFDKPVEHATDVAFEWVEKQFINAQSGSRKELVLFAGLLQFTPDSVEFRNIFKTRSKMSPPKSFRYGLTLGVGHTLGIVQR